MIKVKQLIGLLAICVGLSWSSIGMADEIVVGFSGPLSGPAAEYGQDCLNGAEMAVTELNAAGGITVKGKKYTFRLEKLDDRNDPTQSVNNARRMRSNKAIAVFNGVFNTIAALAKINEEKDNEFLIMAYTSTPKAVQLGNKLLIGTTAPPFTVYLQIFADEGWKRGWRKAAMMVTLGAYGDEWRAAFKDYWQKIGGKITLDKPGNYYRETDFSAQLSAIMETKPDVMLIGGPSATTALVIEQARGMGYKGGFMMIDQAKPDYIADILKGVKLMENTISVAGAMTVFVPVTKTFEKRYKSISKRIVTSEVLRNYGAMIALSRAITVAGTVDNVRAIRAAFPKALPILGDRLPTEIFGINDNGRLQISGSIQMVKGGKFQPPLQYYWWPKTQKEFDAVKRISKTKEKLNWIKPVIKDVM
jgi:branched-chain amino acid transport system substrate-binding protein